jgi:hypothetical protein
MYAQRPLDPWALQDFFTTFRHIGALRGWGTGIPLILDTRYP